MKYDDTMPARIAELTRNGLTDREICKSLDISEGTFWEWKKKIPEVFEAVMQARRWRSQKHLVPKMIKRAKGYVYTEREYVVNGEGTKVLTKETRKHMAPDIGALKFFITKDLEEYQETSRIEHSGSVAHAHEIPAEILDMLQVAHRPPPRSQENDVEGSPDDSLDD